MSTLKVNTIQNTSGGSSSTPEQIEQGRCKVWINIDGDESTYVIRDSFNVTSVSDNGTGQYMINFSITFANNNYCVVTSGFNSGASDGGWISTFAGNGDWNNNNENSTTRCGIVSYNSGGSNQDNKAVCVAFFGDV